MKLCFRPLAAAACIAVAASSFGWIDSGHMVVAAIAEGKLTASALKQVEELVKIGATERTGDFLTAACWADDSKDDKSGPWHYINNHFRKDGKPTDNKPLEENVVWAIGHFSNILRDKFKPAAERADALRYLVHFVGDIHNPMHAVAEDTDDFPQGDRGGNDFKINPGDLFPNMERPPTNLHFLWDMGGGIFETGIQRPLNPETKGKIWITASSLMNKYPMAGFRNLKVADPKEWANESFELAKSISYRLRPNSTPDLSYMTIVKTVAGQRAALAGYRLAELLNRLLG